MTHDVSGSGLLPNMALPDLTAFSASVGMIL